ncbi:MAG: glycosyltransferase [Patescibacteria group bacterium]
MSVNIIRVPQRRDLVSQIRYRSLDRKAWQKLEQSAGALRGRTVIHVNSAVHGGGVAELLRSQIPLERSLGIDSRWYVISAPTEFFAITKKLHNLLQGAPGQLTGAELQSYEKVGSQLAKKFLRVAEGIKDGIVVIHDPQPAALLCALPPHLSSLWRIHVDLSRANLWATGMLQRYARCTKCVVVSNPAYKRAFRGRKVIIHPAIDPFTAKNKPMTLSRARSIIRKFGIHDDLPIMTQVSRFDAWKDPVGVIRAYYLAKKREPRLQLVLAGFMTAQDDPEAVRMLDEVARYAKGDNAIFLFSDTKQLGNLSNEVFINALYTVSTVVVQKSVREGFGLTITEAMWKGKPVIAAPSAGAKIQITNGKNGFIVTSASAIAKKVEILLQQPHLRSQLGRRAHTSVARRFLFPRYILDCLQTYQRLVK